MDVDPRPSALRRVGILMLTRTLQVTRALLRTSLATAMQYRADFLLDATTGLFRTLATAAPLWVVYGLTDAVSGWTLAEATLVMGLFFLMQALVGGLIEPNLGMVVEAVRTGTLDLVLLKPADAQLLVSVRTVAPARLWDGIAALIMIGWSLSQRGSLEPADAVMALTLLLCGLLAIYSVWLIAICASFFFVRVDNLRFLLWSASDAGRWPIDVFSGWVRFVLTAMIPVALVTSYPAMALAGQWQAGLVLQSMTIAGMLLLGSRRLWTWSLTHYTSASS